jgi:hypothetical protein
VSGLVLPPSLPIYPILEAALSCFLRPLPIPHQSTEVGPRIGNSAIMLTCRPLSISTNREKEWADRASRFLKGKLKHAGTGYKELADRLYKHGMEETETSIARKLSRGVFAMSFFLACLAVLGLTCQTCKSGSLREGE